MAAKLCWCVPSSTPGKFNQYHWAQAALSKLHVIQRHFVEWALTSTWRITLIYGGEESSEADNVAKCSTNLSGLDWGGNLLWITHHNLYKDLWTWTHHRSCADLDQCCFLPGDTKGWMSIRVGFVLWHCDSLSLQAGTVANNLLVGRFDPANACTHTWTHRTSDTLQCEMCEFIDCLSASHLLQVCSPFLTCLESTETLLSPAGHFAHSLSSLLFFHHGWTGFDRACWASTLSSNPSLGQSGSQAVKQN